MDNGQNYLLTQTVLVLVDPAANNGHDVAGARITKVHNDGSVNLRILYDVAAGDGYAANIPLFADEAAARDHVKQATTLNIAFFADVATPELGDDDAELLAEDPAPVVADPARDGE